MNRFWLCTVVSIGYALLLVSVFRVQAFPWGFVFFSSTGLFLVLALATSLLCTSPWKNFRATIQAIAFPIVTIALSVAAVLVLVNLSYFLIEATSGYSIVRPPFTPDREFFLIRFRSVMYPLGYFAVATITGVATQQLRKFSHLTLWLFFGTVSALCAFFGLLLAYAAIAGSV